MNVSGASSIVARESSVKLQDSVLIAELNTAEHGVINVGCVSRVSVSVSNYATVHAGGIAVPGFERNLRNGLAGRGIDDLNIKCQRHARVAISNILTNVFARNPWKVSVLIRSIRNRQRLTVRTLCGLRLQDARGIARKNDIVWAIGGDRSVRTMVSVENVFEGALGNATLGTQVLNHSLAAADQSSLTGLEGLSTVLKADV